MAEIDASIPMAAGKLGFDLAGALQIGQQAQALQLNRQKLQQQNALTSLLSDPRSYQPNSTQLTPNALRLVTAADPQTGLSLQQQYLNEQVKRSQDQHYQTETGRLKFDFMTQAAGVAIDAYDDAKRQGRTEQDATAAARAARSQFAQESGGLLTEQEAQRVQGLPFDPTQVRAFASANKEWAGLKEAQARENVADDRASEQARHDRAMERLGQQRINIQLPGVGGVDYSPDAKKMMVDQFIASGGQTVPRFGFGKAGAIERAEFYNEVAKQMKDSGRSGSELPTALAGLKADQASLNQITKVADSSQAFEKTARKNFQQALKLAPQAVPNLGPFFNRWVEQGETMFGNKDVPPYVVALLTGANEYAKIISGSTGSQGSTVDARKEAREMFSQYLDTGQIKAVVDVAFKDMDNKVESYAEQRKDIQDRIRTAGKPAAAPSLPDAAKAKLKKGTLTTFANGQKWTLGDDGQPERVP